MTSRFQIACGWCGVATVIFMVLGMGPIGQLMPPPSPLLEAADIALFFKRNATGVLLGSVFITIGVGLSIATVAGISVQIGRMGSSTAPVLRYIQLASGTTASAFVLLPAMISSTAAYRAERSPEMVLMLHDLATFAFFLPFSVATVQAWTIAAAIFSDRSSRPAFPRWLGYYNLLTGLSYVPSGFIGFFKTGAFASDGMFNVWVPTILVVPWYAIMGLCLIKAEKAWAADDTRPSKSIA